MREVIPFDFWELHMEHTPFGSAPRIYSTKSRSGTLPKGPSGKRLGSSASDRSSKLPANPQHRWSELSGSIGAPE
ncbi:hypothetical protein BS78_05G052800 [Paspalum vaginatum]|nr:hypothetical protein BS78_05G052800 [Paspalum vaginatum]